MGTIKIKRAYEPPEKGDGIRILVDRLWPRGIKKEAAHFDHWLQAIAPSTELRKWFNHDVKRWNEFKTKYEKELTNAPAVEELRTIIKEHKTVTLVYGAKDEQHNQAVVLKEFLDKDT